MLFMLGVIDLCSLCISACQTDWGTFVHMQVRAWMDRVLQEEEEEEDQTGKQKRELILIIVRLKEGRKEDSNSSL